MSPPQGHRRVNSETSSPGVFAFLLAYRSEGAHVSLDNAHNRANVKA
jgi:hypothetical protein